MCTVQAGCRGMVIFDMVKQFIITQRTLRVVVVWEFSPWNFSSHSVQLNMVYEWSFYICHICLQCASPGHICLEFSCYRLCMKEHGDSWYGSTRLHCLWNSCYTVDTESSGSMRVFSALPCHWAGCTAEPCATNRRKMTIGLLIGFIFFSLSPSIWPDYFVLRRCCPRVLKFCMGS